MKKITLTIFFAVVTSITVVQAQSVLDVDYGTLMNEINNNPVRASQLYHNKTIRTTIVVDMVTSDTQVMAGGSAVLYVNFASSERSKVANLNKGQRITVRGVYVGNTLFPNIQRAVIETQPQAKPQTQQQPAQPQQQSTVPMALIGTWKEKGFFLPGDKRWTLTFTNNMLIASTKGFRSEDPVVSSTATKITSPDYSYVYLLTFRYREDEVFLHRNGQELWFQDAIYVKQ